MANRLGCKSWFCHWLWDPGQFPTLVINNLMFPIYCFSAQMHPSAMLSDGILLPMPLKISSIWSMLSSGCWSDTAGGRPFLSFSALLGISGMGLWPSHRSVPAIEPRTWSTCDLVTLALWWPSCSPLFRIESSAWPAHSEGLLPIPTSKFSLEAPAGPRHSPPWRQTPRTVAPSLYPTACSPLTLKALSSPLPVTWRLPAPRLPKEGWSSVHPAIPDPLWPGASLLSSGLLGPSPTRVEPLTHCSSLVLSLTKEIP